MDILKLARKAGIDPDRDIHPTETTIQRFADLVLEEAAGLCDRFAARGMHPAECAAAIRAMKGAK